MLLDHFQLAEQPFAEAPDTRFWFFGKARREALATLVYEMESGRGIALISGASGTGKTSLLLRFRETVQPPARALLAPAMARSPYRLARWLARELSPHATGPDEEAYSHRLYEHLVEDCLPGRRLILLVDDADGLSARTLEWLRQLAAPGIAAGSRVQLVLSGQSRLIDRLSQDALAQLREHIGCVTELTPLDGEETQQYIRHRLWVAGSSQNLHRASPCASRRNQRRDPPRHKQPLFRCSLSCL